jgi:hypothetical protein
MESGQNTRLMTPQEDTIALIRSITEDGELTSEEVFELAEFLNENEEACQVWPGDLLHQALLSVFEDGKMDAEEHQALGELIMAIEKECAESDEQTVWQGQDDDDDGLDYPSSDLVLPGIDRKENSTEDDGRVYEVDMAEHTCECEDWQNTRINLETGSPGRLCKHLVSAFDKVAKSGGCNWSEVLLWLLGERAGRGKGFHAVDHYNVLTLKEGTCLVSFGSSKWAHVIVPVGTDFDRYGYDFQERRWSFGKKPPGVAGVKILINRLQAEAEAE